MSETTNLITSEPMVSVQGALVQCYCLMDKDVMLAAKFMSDEEAANANHERSADPEKTRGQWRLRKEVYGDVVTHLKDPRVQELARMGSEIVIMTMKVAGKYAVMCDHIRQYNLDADIVRLTLQPLGFKKERISEINKVCALPDEEFQALMAGEIGWRGALQLARGSEGETSAKLHIDSALKEAAAAREKVEDAKEADAAEFVREAPKSATVRIKELLAQVEVLLEKENKKRLTVMGERYQFKISLKAKPGRGKDMPA